MPAQGEYRVLHHFAGGNHDGAGPMCALVQSGSALYGMTPQGGSNDLGTIFRINTDGTGFEVLHGFVGASIDGSTPIGALLLSESTLYGMATSPGTTSRGTVFAMNTDGGGFQVVHRFGNNEGKWPYGTLIPCESMLYGLTGYGGSDNGSGWVGGGTLFRMNTNGTGFHVLHTFTLTAADAWSPHGSLVQSGTNLYGATADGGIDRGGTVFRSNLDGSGFKLLHRFVGGATDGRTPGDISTLVVSGSTLYGMTREGGIRNTGTVFRVNTDGSGFKLLHTFLGGTNDGAWPISGSLVLSGSALYGMTPLGGINGTNGTIFKINIDGTGYALLHRFDGLNGREPRGSLFLSGSTLYGMTSAGGGHDLGVIFALELAPQLFISLDATKVNLSWSTNFPDFALQSTEQVAGAWKSEPGVTGYSATRPAAAGSQFFRLASGATVTDIDGNAYKTVTIGKQVWMAENLKTTRYRNGDAIGTTSPATLDISGESTPKYQWAYAGDESHVATYGRLYTWYAVTDSRKLAPTGWHVPSAAEFRTLLNGLGGAGVARGKLKESGATHWQSPNLEATNESGFTALPGGSHWNDVFVAMGLYGHWWSTELQAPGWAWRMALSYTNMDVSTVLNSADPKIGWSVRCVRDTPALGKVSRGVEDNRDELPSE